jgi:hypothetical protein
MTDNGIKSYFILNICYSMYASNGKYVKRHWFCQTTNGSIKHVRISDKKVKEVNMNWSCRMPDIYDRKRQ